MVVSAMLDSIDNGSFKEHLPWFNCGSWRDCVFIPDTMLSISQL
jgi:hypothetical protein